VLERRIATLERTAFLRKLAWRGLRGVKLVISDAHKGIKAAAAKVLCASEPYSCKGGT
jgi:transposase-like protein